MRKIILGALITSSLLFANGLTKEESNILNMFNSDLIKFTKDVEIFDGDYSQLGELKEFQGSNCKFYFAPSLSKNSKMFNMAYDCTTTNGSVSLYEKIDFAFDKFINRAWKGNYSGDEGIIDNVNSIEDYSTLKDIKLDMNWFDTMNDSYDIMDRPVKVFDGKTYSVNLKKLKTK